MTRALKILLVEDSIADAELLEHNLAKSGLAFVATRVDSIAQLNESLQTSWDAIICDYDLKGFTAFDALAAAQQHGHDLPFLVLSGIVPDDVGVSLMKAGADDVIIKTRMTRLVPALQREIKDAEL